MQIPNNPNRVYGTSDKSFQVLNSSVVGFNVDMNPNYSGVGTATNGVPRISGGAVNDNDDSFMKSNRVIEGDALFSHAFRAFDTFKSDSAGAYTTFDSRSTVVTNDDASKYNHSYGFQWNMTFDAANGIDLMSALISIPILESGHVDRLHHIEIRDPIQNGGTVGEHVGIYISPLTDGTVSTFGIFQLGDELNYFGGNIQGAGAVAVKDVTARGTLTAFPTGGGVSIVGVAGPAELGGIQHWDDAFGTPGILTIQYAGSKAIIGGSVPANGAILEVQGDITSDDYITGLSVIGTGDLHANGNFSHFDDDGGVAIGGTITGDNGAAIRAYADNVGAPKTLYIQDNGGGLVIGANAQVVGGDCEVVGDLNVSNGNLKCNQKILAEDGLGVGNSAAATTPGTVIGKMQVFDAAGSPLGFVALYDAIT